MLVEFGIKEAALPLHHSSPHPPQKWPFFMVENDVRFAFHELEKPLPIRFSFDPALSVDSELVHATAGTKLQKLLHSIRDNDRKAFL